MSRAAFETWIRHTFLEICATVVDRLPDLGLTRLSAKAQAIRAVSDRFV